MQSLVITFEHRPYVFAFLMTFLLIGILNRGMTRTLFFLAIGYGVAFLSEFSSIRNGFPYGTYHYIYENLRGEILLGGVPVWDSLSYTFIAYASYETTWFFLCRGAAGCAQQGEASLAPTWRVLFVAAVLMTLLDVIIDPLAVRGDRWFLGKIFYYPNGGIYFGVPLSNFAGWFLVALIIFGSYQFLGKRLCKKPPPLRAAVLGPLFYCSILLFNLAITFWIGEIALGLAGLLIAVTPAAALFARSRQKRGF